MHLLKYGKGDVHPNGEVHCHARVALNAGFKRPEQHALPTIKAATAAPSGKSRALVAMLSPLPQEVFLAWCGRLIYSIP